MKPNACLCRRVAKSSTQQFVTQRPRISALEFSLRPPLQQSLPSPFFQGRASWIPASSVTSSVGSLRTYRREVESGSGTGIDKATRSRVSSLLVDSSADYPVGVLDEELLETAEEALESWSLERSPEGFEFSLRLLQRLVLEQQYVEKKCSEGQLRDSDLYQVSPYLVNRVVDCWRICWTSNRVNFPPADMLRILGEFETRGVSPSNRAFTMIIEGMIQRGDKFETPLLAQWLLDRRMELAEEDPSLRPDTIFLTSVIRAWAKSGRLEGPEMAEGILGLMHDLYDGGWKQAAPNALSYTAVMEAWDQSRHPEAAIALERLLNQMKQTMIHDLQPDSLIYSYVINAWVHSKSPGALQKAQDYLQEMIGLYDNGDDVVPRVSDFSKVMLACARAGQHRIVEQLYSQLRRLNQETDTAAFMPDHHCKKAMLVAMMKKGNLTISESILDDLVSSARQRLNPMPPRSYFVDLLVAWTKIRNRRDAAIQSERFLRKMIELAETTNPEMMPDALSFLKVMRAWSTAQTKDAGHKTEQLLNILVDLFEDTGKPALKPTAKHWEVAVLAWSRTTVEDAAEQAESLVREMELQWSDGDQEMMPSRAVYTNLMQAWIRTGRSGNPGRVQEIFEKLYHLYKNGSMKHQPDLMVFSTAMDAWARVRNAEKTLMVFEQMVEEFVNGNQGARPDMQAFNKILKAYARSRDPKKGENAEMILARLGELSERCGVQLKPDEYTLGEMVLVWSGSQTPGAANKAEEYLRLFLKNGFEPPFALYQAVIEAWLRSEDPVATQNAAEILENLLTAAQARKLRAPHSKPYRRFLRSVAESSIPTRNEQARYMLETLPEGQVIPELLVSV
eukprot:Nitzschia sp. Nitz4//scaffold37_size175936//164208//166748//NITZ4_002069-RA/size175936-processed-gene-0.65-mRNA-1//1//CDS//3329549857//1646//frame0